MATMKTQEFIVPAPVPVLLDCTGHLLRDIIFMDAQHARRDDLPLNVVVIFLSVKLVQQDISVTFCPLFHALFAPQAM